MSEAEVICEKMGRCGVITLNRPKALNALTLNMVRIIAAALDQWESDAGVHSVAIRGAGNRAFCAGGDIKRLYELGRAGDYAEQLAFWREEYQLNYRIKTYPKPYVALIEGIIMGGGAGVGIHARHAVAAHRGSRLPRGADRARRFAPRGSRSFRQRVESRARYGASAS